MKRHDAAGHPMCVRPGCGRPILPGQRSVRMSAGSMHAACYEANAAKAAALFAAAKAEGRFPNDDANK